MLIENKWVVRETRDDLYFTGMDPGGFPVLEHLNSRVRTYKNERSAKMAVNRIGAVEYCEFAAEYIKYANVPDVPEDKPDKKIIGSEEMSVVKDASGWETVLACAVPPGKIDGKAAFAKISLCRKRIGDREIFGVIAADGKLYSAGLNGGETALRRFLAEYYEYLLPRVTRG